MGNSVLASTLIAKLVQEIAKLLQQVKNEKKVVAEKQDEIKSLSSAHTSKAHEKVNVVVFELQHKKIPEKERLQTFSTAEKKKAEIVKKLQHLDNASF